MVTIVPGHGERFQTVFLLTPGPRHLQAFKEWARGAAERVWTRGGRRGQGRIQASCLIPVVDNLPCFLPGWMDLEGKTVYLFIEVNKWYNFFIEVNTCFR